MTDGDIDYSQFSRAQLDEALTRIDGKRFPLNHESLMKELGLRPLATSIPRQKDMRVWVTFIGWYQIVAAAALCYHAVTTWSFDVSDLRKLILLLPLSALTVVILSLFLTLCLLIITGIAGVLTVRGNRLGPRLSIVTFAAQVIAITLPGFSYQYVSLIALQLSWSSEKFGITASLGPDTTVRLGGSDPLFIAVDIFALAAILILVMSIRHNLPANQRLERP